MQFRDVEEHMRARSRRRQERFCGRLEADLEVEDAEVISLVQRTLTVLVHFILLWPRRREPFRHIGCMVRCVVVVVVDCGEVALRIDGQVQDVKAGSEVSKLLGVLVLCGVKGFHAVRFDMPAGRAAFITR